MSQPEARIGRSIRKWFEDRGAFVFKVHGSEMMMVGLPDLMVCYRGHFIGIEVKQPGQRPTPRQTYVHGLIRAAGGRAIVATSIDDVRRQLDIHH